MPLTKISGAVIDSSSNVTFANVTATSGFFSAGGTPLSTGPKITNIQVTDNSYTVLDDTAVSTSGGYIKITGTGFSLGCQVLINTTTATSVTFVSSTKVRAQISAQSAGTYVVYLVNSDGGAASDYFNGYISDLRITKGIARYTSNFTAPSSPFIAK